MKKSTILMAALVVVAALAAQPVSAQEDRRGDEGSVRAERFAKQENCAPGPVGGEYVCTSGSFTGNFLSTGGPDSAGCHFEETVDWGDGSVEPVPPNGPGWGNPVDVSHQYKKPGTYVVVVTGTVFCPDSTHGPNTEHPYTVEVPGAQKCEQGASRMSTTSDEEDPCSDQNCHVSMYFFCLIDTELQDAKDEVDEIQKKIKKAKEIEDPEDRAEKLQDLRKELRYATEEYTKLKREAEKKARENAKKQGVSAKPVLKEFNDALQGK